MTTGTRNLVLLALVSAIIAVGCNQGPNGQTEPAQLLFPWEGQLGDTSTGTTVAIVLDSEYIPFFDSHEFHNLHTDRVRIWLSNVAPDVWDSVEIIPRSVFSLAVPPSSKRHLTQPGASVTIALFDLPNASAVPLAPQTPFVANVEVWIDQVAVATPTPEFLITGVSGTSNPIVADSIAALYPEFDEFLPSLEPQRMIRLRGKRGLSGDDLFYIGQNAIAGIEFDFIYPSDCLNNLRAYARTEASNATVFVGAPVVDAMAGLETVKVILTDPKGFDLGFLLDFPTYNNADTTLAGTGPLLDLAFDDEMGSTCLDPGVFPDEFPSEFAIENLFVTDVNGMPIIGPLTTVKIDSGAATDSLALFRIYPVDVEKL